MLAGRKSAFGPATERSGDRSTHCGKRAALALKDAIYSMPLTRSSYRLNQHRSNRFAKGLPHFSIADVFPKRAGENSEDAADPTSSRPTLFAGFPAVLPGIAPFLSQYSSLLHGLVSFYPWPFYLLMALAPRASVTRNLLFSTMSLIPLGLIYAVLLAASWTSDSMSKLLPGSLEAGLKSMAEGKATMQFMPSLESVSELLSRPLASLSAWAHLQFVSFFLARWVWIDGVLKDVPIWHSILLCGLLPPLGFLSHIITCFVYRSIHGDVEAEAPPAVAPPSPPMPAAAGARSSSGSSGSSEASGTTPEEPSARSTPSKFIAPAANGPTPPKGFPGSTFEETPKSDTAATQEAGGGSSEAVEAAGKAASGGDTPPSESSRGGGGQSIAATSVSNADSVLKPSSAAAQQASREQTPSTATPVSKQRPGNEEQHLSAKASSNSFSLARDEPDIKSHPVAGSVDRDETTSAPAKQVAAKQDMSASRHVSQQNGRGKPKFGANKNGLGHSIASADWLTILPVTYVNRH